VLADAHAGGASLTFLITGEQMGRLGPCGCTEETVGGLTRRATLLRLLRNQAPGDVILLDNGGLVFEAGRQQELKYEVSLRAMAEMQYDVAGVGFKDVSLSMSLIEAAAIDSPFPILASNLTDPHDDFPLARSAAIETAGGARVGVLAILGSRFKDELDMMAADAQLLDPLAVLPGLVAELSPRVDLIVLLSHAPLEETRRILQEVEGVHVAVTGYLVEKPFEEPELVGDCLLLGTGLYGKWIAKLSVTLDDRGRILSHAYSPVFIDGRYPEDPEIVDILEDYRLAVIEERLIDKMPRKTLSGPAYVGSSACLRCHRPQFRKWITTRHGHALASLEKDGTDKDPECVKCHVVGLEYRGGFRNPELTPDLAGNGCEECHGGGAYHLRNVLAPYHRPTVEDCRSCHDPENSPSFDFHTYYPKIDHRRTTLDQTASTE